ncbi:hypothetical protein [Allorhizocola rhizosphaerae]|uniref:hypothetical protein n=1 Tax=Allorhizocola rhizosphaerae TaxID=1872709 RepID=UPI000E3B9182|nr:hypothetical protein [Allorhizocola rhizosphaerae]
MVTEVSARTVPATQAATAWLLEKLTQRGKISFRLACARLTAWEAILVQHVLGRHDVTIAGAPVPDGWSIPVTATVLDGIAFWDTASTPAPPGEVLAWLHAPTQLRDMVTEEAELWQARESAEMCEIDAILHDWESDGVLQAKVAELADRVERVETVYVLIGRDVFSKSDAGSNTLTRDELLLRLQRLPLAQWRASDRLFVVAAQCLFHSGRSVRFEEFNGKQLSATALRQFLNERYTSYCRALGRAPAQLHRLSLLDLSRLVRELLPQVDRSRSMRYRRINGLTFVKSEYVTDFAHPRAFAQLPPLLEEQAFHLGTPVTGDAAADMRAMTRAAAEIDAERADDEGGAGAIGELIGAIVLSAVAASDSDYGMSSSVRDLARLRGSLPGRPDGVLELKKGDFFCCCLPHPVRMDALTTDEEKVTTLWRVAQRMMYNRWHFAPGEFDRAEIPLKRHYFFPPQIPDIAEHSEHHHGGHVSARVRYSIRAPGAQVWREPFHVFGHGFRGCYDIRLVRMEGPAYTLAEVHTAVKHCSLVEEVWRTLADGVEHGTFRWRPIGGFDRAWYESHAWEKLHPYEVLADRLAGASEA